LSDITRVRGDTYADEFVFRNKKTGQPLDLTGYSLKMTVDPLKDPVDAAANLYQLAGTITDAVGGKVEFSPTATQADQVGSYFYDVQMIDALGRIRTAVTGKYKYVQDITK
jgi:hypothetical protein